MITTNKPSPLFQLFEKCEALGLCVRVSFSENMIYIIDDIKVNQTIFKTELDDELDNCANKALEFLKRWK